jgi:DNA-binding response OmpR family regulator
MRMLVIEDDADIRETLRSNLEAECFAVDTAEDGEQGIYLAKTNEYDVVVLDCMLPKADGRSVCQAIRTSRKGPYIIMLSVKTETPFKVDLLNLGADDYLSKPFSFEELLARIRALLRRPKLIQSETMSVGEVVLETRSQTVWRAGKEVYLTRKEYMLFEYLLRNKGGVVTRSMLAEHVWDSNLDTFSNTIESHILNLRKKLDGKRKESIIQTITGRGYRIGSQLAEVMA